MVSGLLTRHICYVHLFLNHNWFSADIFLVLCYTILHLIDIGKSDTRGMVCLLRLGHLVPLPI